MHPGQLIVLLLSCSLSGIYAADDECHVYEEDHYLISPLLENSLSNNCLALRKLAGAFFTTQETPPRSVRVTYLLNIPINKDCHRQCSHCWSEEICNNSSFCPEDHCCVTREFIWGRIPLIVEDNIYRTLSICPFMIGGNTEKKIEINLTLSDTAEPNDTISCITTRQFPCAWCIGSELFKRKDYSGVNTVDNVMTFEQQYSPLDQALVTLTEKLQGYAVKAQALPWLRYSSDLAIGYAAPYPVFAYSTISLVRYMGFLFSYVLFHIILFMLIYKYRRRLYRRLYTYINTDPINSAFLYSFITTSILTCFGMLTATSSGGYCLTLLQVILLAVALFFSLPHGLITCFRLKKRPDFFTTYPFFCCFVRWKWCNIILQIFVFWFLYSMPHVILYLVMIFWINFFFSPYSYLIVLMFLVLSILVLWIGNAIVFHLISPSSPNLLHICKNKGERRRLIFAIFIACSVNVLYFTAWHFVTAFFYDRRGHATTYLTFIPGFTIALVGWYLSGDLVKLFDMFTRGKTEENIGRDNGEESLAIVESLKDEDERKSDQESLDELHVVQQKGERARYSVKRLRRVVKAVTRHPSFSIQENDDELTELVERNSY